MYQTIDHLIVAVPMPGLKPEDISIAIKADPLRLTLQGDERGSRQHQLNLLLAELLVYWSIFPGTRLTLP
jgi:HSP20 family molecular chaperone IbpA